MTHTEPPTPDSLYRLLVQEVKDYAIYLIDPEGRVLSWNEGAQLIKGYAPDTIRGQHFSIFYTPEDRARGVTEHEMQQAIQHGRYEEPGWRVRQDGSRFWADEIITALRDASGALVGFAKISRDLTAQHDAESALRETEQRYRAVVDGVEDYAIFMARPDHTITTWNAGAERIIGYTEAEAVGRSGAMIFTPTDRARGEDRKELLTAATNGRAEDERWHLRKDGTRFWGSGIMTARYDAAGSLIGFVKIVRDQTARKHAEEELRTLNETLEQRVNERTGAMLAYQQHLRTLAAELGRTEQRERQRIATELHDHLAQTLAVCKMKLAVVRDAFPRGKVPKAARDLQDLLQQALTYTRTLMTDLSPVILSENDLPAAVEWVADKMRKHGLNVTVEDDGQPKPLDEDVLTFLFQSVRELLFNIVKHARTAEARVRLERAGRQVRVTVEDPGSGFDPSTKAFEPSGEGGFGLFNIRERLGLLGGQINIDSAPGRGTRIALITDLDEARANATAPADRADGDGDSATGERVGQPSASPPNDVPAAAAAARVIRVVIVDDQKIMRDGLRSIIADQRDLHVIGEAADGQEAVDLVRRTMPDVVIMDINMPRMNGLEATRIITGEMPSVRVIGLSVQTDRDMAAEMQKAGAAAFLSKGDAAETLCTTIRRVAGIPERADEPA